MTRDEYDNEFGGAQDFLDEMCQNVDDLAHNYYVWPETEVQRIKGYVPEARKKAIDALSVVLARNGMAFSVMSSRRAYCGAEDFRRYLGEAVEIVTKEGEKLLPKTIWANYHDLSPVMVEIETDDGPRIICACCADELGYVVYGHSHGVKDIEDVLGRGRLRAFEESFKGNESDPMANIVYYVGEYCPECNRMIGEDDPGYFDEMYIEWLKDEKDITVHRHISYTYTFGAGT